jgi:hypothetical protein
MTCHHNDFKSGQVERMSGKTDCSRIQKCNNKIFRNYFNQLSNSNNGIQGRQLLVKIFASAASDRKAHKMPQEIQRKNGQHPT